jgi:hypothetical protein
MNGEISRRSDRVGLIVIPVGVYMYFLNWIGAGSNIVSAHAV